MLYRFEIPLHYSNCNNCLAGVLVMITEQAGSTNTGYGYTVFFLTVGFGRLIVGEQLSDLLTAHRHV